MPSNSLYSLETAHSIGTFQKENWGPLKLKGASTTEQQTTLTAPTWTQHQANLALGRTHLFLNITGCTKPPEKDAKSRVFSFLEQKCSVTNVERTE